MSEADLSSGRTALQRWQPPAEFYAKVEELAKTIKSEELFNLTAMGFVLDAMILAEFTKFRPTEKVRLVDQKEQWPDGQTGTPEHPIDVEVTEVLVEGRKRGEEYRKSHRREDGTAEDWRKRALAIPQLLENAIGRKTQKRYSRKCILVIYVNVSNYGILQKETELKIAEINAKYAKDFHEICVLWQGKLL